jgi:hypothetical protein
MHTNIKSNLIYLMWLVAIIATIFSFIVYSERVELLDKKEAKERQLDMARVQLMNLNRLGKPKQMYPLMNSFEILRQLGLDGQSIDLKVEIGSKSAKGKNTGLSGQKTNYRGILKVDVSMAIMLKSIEDIAASLNLFNKVQQRLPIDKVTITSKSNKIELKGTLYGF